MFWDSYLIDLGGEVIRCRGDILLFSTLLTATSHTTIMAQSSPSIIRRDVTVMSSQEFSFPACDSNFRLRRTSIILVSPHFLIIWWWFVKRSVIRQEEKPPTDKLVAVHTS